MSSNPSPKVPPGDERVSRGEKSTKTSHSATSGKPEASATQKTEKPGKQTQAEHDKIAASGKGHTIKAGGAK